MKATTEKTIKKAKSTPRIAKEKKVKTPVSLNAAVYNQSGVAAGTLTLPSKVFGVAWNADLVHQVVVAMMANKRAGTAHTKDRSEVSGGGKKPWKQKGTGRSRHGSNRSPIWTGGGITFGPRNDKDYSQKINKKMRVKALYTVLSRKLSDGKILFIDSLALSEIKTKTAQDVLNTLATIGGFEKITYKKQTAVLVALPEKNAILEKSFANLPGVTMITASELNPLMAMEFQHVVFVNPASAIALLEAKAESKSK